MQTNDLKRRTPFLKAKLIGRGGKRGKTSGRGGKGQTARTGNKRRPEIREVIKRIPKLRGRGKNSNLSIQEKLFPVNLSQVEAAFKAGEKVTPASLISKGVITLQKGKRPVVKILATGELTKKLTFADCAFSGSAREKIEKAGGKILLLVPKEA